MGAPRATPANLHTTQPSFVHHGSAALAASRMQGRMRFAVALVLWAARCRGPSEVPCASSFCRAVAPRVTPANLRMMWQSLAQHGSVALVASGMRDGMRFAVALAQW